MNKFLVYVHIRQDTNEIFYVGKGTKKRIRQKDNRNKYWHNIVNKNNGFISQVIAGNLSDKEALAFEVLIIAKLKALGVKLCNMTNGGEGVAGLVRSPESIKKQADAIRGRPSKNLGRKATEQARLNMSLAHKGKKQSPEHIKKCADARRGKVYSAEHRLKISKALTGKKIPKEHILKRCIPVICITTGIVYESATEAGRQLKLYSTNIAKCCRNKLNQTGNLQFSYYEKGLTA